MEWNYLLDSPARGVKRFRVENRRTRILTPDEQRRLLNACPKAAQAASHPDLGADLRRPHRRAAEPALGGLPGRLHDLLADEERQGEAHPHHGRRSRPCWRACRGSTRGSSPTPRPKLPYTTISKVFERALARAKITTGDVTVHTLRHTALSRMIEHGLDDHTVMSISGHSSTRMLERYTHPTLERKLAALQTFDLIATTVATNWPQKLKAADTDASTARELAKLLGNVGGRQEARTPDLRVANAALSQLS